MATDLGRIVNEKWESGLMKSYITIHDMVYEIGELYVHDIEGKAKEDDVSAFYSLIGDVQKTVDRFQEKLDYRREIDMGIYTRSLECLELALGRMRTSPYCDR